MQTMKNTVGRKLAKSWPGKSLIKVGQKVDEVWMAFKANKVGRKLDKSWTDFKGKKVQRGYNDGTTFLKNRVCQGYANDMPEFRSKRLLQLFSNTSPEIDTQKVSQQLPNAYPENKGFSLKVSGQNQYEIGIKICLWFVGEMWVEYFVKVSVRFRQFGGYRVGQFLGKTWVDLVPFYPGIKQVIQPLSFITHSFIVHNKRVSYGKCDQLLPNATGNSLSLFDIARVSLYVVLPDQYL